MWDFIDHLMSFEGGNPVEKYWNWMITGNLLEQFAKFLFTGTTITAFSTLRIFTGVFMIIFGYLIWMIYLNMMYPEPKQEEIF